MNDINKLVERLREQLQRETRCDGQRESLHEPMAMARDAIEQCDRLRAQNAELIAKMHEWNGVIKRLESGLIAVNGFADTLRAQRDQLRSECDTLRAQLHEIESAPDKPAPKVLYVVTTPGREPEAFFTEAAAQRFLNSNNFSCSIRKFVEINASSSSSSSD